MPNAKTTKTTKAATAVNLPATTPAQAAAPAVESKPDLSAQTRESRNLARDAATVTAQRTNFGSVTDRDAAYRLFFGDAMRGNGHKATLAAIHAAGKLIGNKRFNPYYAGSAKATDAGAINRAIKAGYFTVSADGSTLTATDLAKSDKAYNGKA